MTQGGQGRQGEMPHWGDGGRTESRRTQAEEWKAEPVCASLCRPSEFCGPVPGGGVGLSQQGGPTRPRGALGGGASLVLFHSCSGSLWCLLSGRLWGSRKASALSSLPPGLFVSIIKMVFNMLSLLLFGRGDKKVICNKFIQTVQFRPVPGG